MRICTKCKVNRELKCFSKSKNHSEGIYSICKICVKEYKNNNKEKFKIADINNYLKRKNTLKLKNYRKQYRTKNSKELKEYNKKYYSNNRSYFFNRNNKKYKFDYIHKLESLLRSRINIALKTQITSKTNKSNKLLGCSIQEYKQYLEKQFKPEMSWSNHGKIWEIDHIVGICNFDLTKPEEQAKCFHYSNTRPLFKTTEIAESFGYLNEIGNRDREKIK